MEGSINRGSKEQPKHTMILVIRAPQKGPLIFGNTYRGLVTTVSISFGGPLEVYLISDAVGISGRWNHNIEKS